MSRTPVVPSNSSDCLEGQVHPAQGSCKHNMKNLSLHITKATNLRRLLSSTAIPQTDTIHHPLPVSWSINDRFLSHEPQNRFVHANARKFPHDIQDKKYMGIGMKTANTTRNHNGKKTGDGEENVRPAALYDVFPYREHRTRKS